MSLKKKNLQIKFTQRGKFSRNEINSECAQQKKISGWSSLRSRSTNVWLQYLGAGEGETHKVMGLQRTGQ